MLYILILLVGALFSFFGPWWIMAPVAFVLCFFVSRKMASAFWASALAGITLWLGYSIYLHLSSSADLAAKVMGVFTANLPALANVPGMVGVLVIGALIVGPVSGFSGLAGAEVRQLIRPHRS